MAHRPAYFIPIRAPFENVRSQAQSAVKASLTSGAISVPATPPIAITSATWAIQQNNHRIVVVTAWVSGAPVFGLVRVCGI